MKIILYSAPHCAYCTMAKKFFNDRGIAYEERDVSKDPVAFAAMERVSHQRGVPVIEIGNEVFVGFDRRAIERALAT